MRYRRSAKVKSEIDTSPPAIIDIIADTRMQEDVYEGVSKDIALDSLETEIDKLQALLDIIDMYISYKPILSKRLKVCETAYTKLLELKNAFKTLEKPDEPSVIVSSDLIDSDNLDHLADFK